MQLFYLATKKNINISLTGRFYIAQETYILSFSIEMYKLKIPGHCSYRS